MDKSQNPPHIPMDTMSTVPTQVSGQTTVMVSLDTNTLIAACQGAAWKISGLPENIAIHHAKGCTCCHEYINHLLGAQSLRQINLQRIDVENVMNLFKYFNDRLPKYNFIEVAACMQHTIR